MKISYYPGCTLSTKAKSLDKSARAVASAIGIELVELPNWTCCGAAFPLVDDNLIGMAAAARILANAKKEGGKLTTLCAFCYNVLKRTNNVIATDKEKRKRLNMFLEEDYDGSTKVLHFIEVLRDEVGFETLSKKIKKKVNIKVAPYYGCLLLRPYEEIKLDDPEAPSILENFLESIGCEVVDFPYKVECCGSYLAISSQDAAVDCSYSILNSAIRNGAEAIAVSCPLCYFNLDERQKEMFDRYKGFRGVPIFYFTQLLALAMELDVGVDPNQHFVSPLPLLKEKGLLKMEVTR